MSKTPKTDRNGRFTRILQILITDELLEEYRKAAKADGRTVSGWMRHIADGELKKAAAKGR